MKLGMMKLSKDTKETLLGGVAGALTFNMESAANGLVVGYPQILKDRLINELPRNGELLSTLAPVGVTWAIAKKKHSSRVHNIRNGVMLYDLPRLMGLFVYRIAYSMGTPSATQAGRFNGNQLRLTVNRPLNNRITASNPSFNVPSSSGGKYVMKTSSTPQMGGGIGKYR